MASRMSLGSPLLTGSNTTPGLQLSKELRELVPTILKACRDYGFDFYPTIVQPLTFDEMAAVASFGGFPSRYPHWKWGMEFEEMKHGYLNGLYKIYEMASNTAPCYIWILNSNTILDNVTVIAHATGHNHFFKNNLHFAPTSGNMINTLASHGTAIRRYMSRWGHKQVTEFIDQVLHLDNLIDPAKAWEQREIKDLVIKDKREYYTPSRVAVSKERLHMYHYLNPQHMIERDKERIINKEIADELGLFQNADKDILGHLRDNAPLKPWQTDIVGMLHEEALYFDPQRKTKTINEGCACVKSDTLILTDQGILKAVDIVDKKLNVKVSDSEQEQKVSNWFSFDDHDTIEMTTKRGYVIDGSVTRRILNANKEWKRLDELKIGDEVLISFGQNMWNKSYQDIFYQPCKRDTITTLVKEGVGSKHQIIKCLKEGTHSNVALLERVTRYKSQDLSVIKRNCDVTFPTIMDENLAAFLGYLIGDGWNGKRGRVFGIVSADKEQNTRFAELGKKLFNLKPKFTVEPTKTYVRFYSKDVQDYLNKLGIPYGKSARIKTVPEMILRSPKSVMASFLRAYFDTDGYGGKSGVILSTSSPMMTKQIQVILLNFGILSTKAAKAKGNYHIHVLGKFAKVFLEEIGFNLTRKQNGLIGYVTNRRWFRKQKLTDKIVSLKSGKGTVYDISIDVSHKYVAQGFVNHNSIADHKIMACMGLVGLGQKSHDCGIIEYAKHKMGVLGGEWSQNPYKIGYELFTDIEERWNKGRFGPEYNACDNLHERENWDTKAGLGKEKMFEVMKYHNDVTLIAEFFTQEFCDKHKFFEWEKKPNGDIEIKTKNAKKIKKKLINRYLNGGYPEIVLADPNFKGKGYYLLEHKWDGRELHEPYARATLTAIHSLWKNDVFLTSRNDNNEEIIYMCAGHDDPERDVIVITREEYDNKW